MAVQELYFSLRGFRGNGAILAGEDFITPLGVTLEPPIVDIHESARPWSATNINFLSVTMSECGEGEGAYDLFNEKTTTAFMAFAEWLSRREPSLFDELRQKGITIDVFIGGWMDDDSQFDLRLPPAMLLECGRRGLEITVCTND